MDWVHRSRGAFRRTTENWKMRKMWKIQFVICLFTNIPLPISKRGPADTESDEKRSTHFTQAKVSLPAYCNIVSRIICEKHTNSILHENIAKETSMDGIKKFLVRLEQPPITRKIIFLQAARMQWILWFPGAQFFLTQRMTFFQIKHWRSRNGFETITIVEFDGYR